MEQQSIKRRIDILKYSIKTTTSLCTKIVLEAELNKLTKNIK